MLKNKISNHYKSITPLENRIKQSAEIMEKHYPERIGIIIQRHPNETNIAEFDKNKFLVPMDLGYSSLMCIIRKKVCSKIHPSTAMFLCTEDGTMLSSHNVMCEIYDVHKDREDHFLYLYYTGENTFG